MRFLQRLAASISLFALTLPVAVFADVPVRSCCAVFEASAISRCFQLNDNLPGTPTQEQLVAARNAQEQTCKDVPLQYQDHQGGSAQWIKNDVNNSGVCGTASSVVCTTIRDQYSRTYFPLHAMCESVSNCPNQTSYLCQEGFCKLKDGQRCTGSEGSEANCADGLLCRSTPEGFKCLAPDADVSGSGGAAAGGFVSQEPAPFVPVVPKLGVPIPGFSFTSATEENGLVSVPYLSQYINAIYRYMTAIVLTVAIVMVMIGGFKYLLSATPLAVSDGKKMITDSLIGMVLVLGAYVILNTVNPSLTSLKTLQLAGVDSIEFQYLLSTESSTVDWSEAEISSSATPSQTTASGINFSAGATNANTTCPVTLTTPVSSPFRPRDARVETFMTAMRSRTNGMSTRQKVITSAQAAMSCELHMGSCGNSVKTIYEIAGINNSGVPQRTIGSSGVRYLMGINQDCVTNHAGSRECKTNARVAAARQFSAQNSGWPNAWAADLQPGDHLWIYTAHSGGAGQHATIFLGWAGRGRARVFNGQYAHLVKESTFCITTDCSNMYPITNIWRPE